MKKNIKTKVFKDNEKYFKFASRDDVVIFSVGFTKNRDIRVYYEIKVAGVKRVNKRLEKSILAV